MRLMARDFVIVACCKLVSLLTKLLTLSQEIDLLYGGQLYMYIAYCKDKGTCNALKPYLPTKKTVVVLKTVVLERVWVADLVHPCIIKSSLPLTSRM